jgi:DNA ligase-1
VDAHEVGEAVAAGAIDHEVGLVADGGGKTGRSGDDDDDDDDVGQQRLIQAGGVGARFRILEQFSAWCVRDILNFEHDTLTKAFEGIIIRDPHAPYKYGRSTKKEGGMLKLKRFCEAEGEIVGFTQLFHNNNPAEEDELGLTKRSSAKSGKKPDALLGAFLINSFEGLSFSVW